MATYSFGSDLQNYQSANAYRSAVERRDREREFEQYIKEIDGEVKPVVKVAEKTVEEVAAEVGKAFHDTQFDREAKNMEESAKTVKAVANIAVGMALIVSSCAAEAAYNKAIYDANNSMNKDYTNELNRRVDNSLNKQQQTLADYAQATTTERHRLENTQYTYRVEYQYTKEEALRTIDMAQREYNREKSDIAREEKRVDTAYRKEKDAANDSLRNAQTVRDTNVQTSLSARDSAIQAAETRYNADVQRIRSEYPSGANLERELSRAAERRDESMSRANQTHNANVQKYSDDYKRQESDIQRQVAAATQRHTAEIERLHDRVATAETKKNTAINHQNDVIRTAQIKYSDAVKQAKSEYTNAQDKQAKYQENAAKIGSSAVMAVVIGNGQKTAYERGNEFAKKFGTAEEILVLDKVQMDKKAKAEATSKGTPYKSSVTKQESQMARQISEKYTNLVVANELVKMRGTDEEKRLVKKVNDDLKEAKKAEKQGVTHISTVTDDERQRIKEMTSGYAVAVNAGVAGAKLYNEKPKAAIFGSQAERLARAIDSNHKQIGFDLAHTFGRVEDIAVLDRVQADKAAKVEAKKNGTTHIPLATKEDYAEANRIIKSYAGDIKTEKDLKKTIGNLEKAERNLSAKRSELQQKIATKTSEIKTLDDKIVALQKKADQITADKQALLTGKDASGAKLTDKQKQEIAERIKNNGNASGLMKQLTDLKQQKNSSKKDLGKLDSDLTKTNNLLTGLKNHVDRLKKNGKVMQALDRRKEAMQKRGAAMVFGSVGMLAKKFNDTMSKGNDIQREFNRMKADTNKLVNNLANIGGKYDRAVTISKFVVKSLTMPGRAFVNIGSRGIVRTIGGNNTRLGRALIGLGQGTKAVGNVAAGLAGAALGAPSAILRAPKKIKELPKKAARSVTNGSLRLTRKTVGFVGGGAAKLASKTAKGAVKTTGKAIKFGINHTIGKKAWYQNAAERVNTFRKQVSGATKKAVSKLNIFGRKKEKKGGGIIGAIFSGLISLITSSVSFLFGGLLMWIIFIVVILIIMSMLTSVFGAVGDWLDGLMSENQTLVKNEPEFIVNHAVNYRNAELDILELFRMTNEGIVKIEINDDPIHYALYDTGFKWPWESRGESLQSFNEGAKLWLHQLDRSSRDAGYEFKSNGSTYSFTKDDVYEWYRFNINAYDALTFASHLDDYYRVKLSYYSADDVVLDADESVLYGTKSNYEISNAKDALALVDALYTQKQDKMQKIEVLSYLGVGEKYQLGKGDDEAINNLFLATHKLAYNSGNKNEDIWFHATNERSSGSWAYSDTVRYNVNLNEKYTVGTSTTNTSHTEQTCDNMATITLKYEREDTEFHDYWYSPHDEGDCIGGETYSRSGSTITYYCDGVHERYCALEKKVVDKYVEYQFCKGHIDLDVAMIVTTMEDGDEDGDGVGDALFEAAASVHGLEEDTPVDGFFGLFTWDRSTGVFGLGGATYYAFNPEDDWTSESDSIDLAVTKTQTKFEYDTGGKDAKELAEEMGKIKHYEDDLFWGLSQSPEEKLLLGMRLGGKTYYVDGFVSGEQNGLVFYRDENKYELSIEVKDDRRTGNTAISAHESLIRDP